MQLNTFVCQAEENVMKFVFYPIGLVISCVFLAITLIVYLSLPKVRYTFTTHTHKRSICRALNCLETA